MHLMNNQFILRIIILLFFFSCNEKENTSISNSFTGELNLEYKLNIDSDSGDNLESVTITWNQSGEEMTMEDEDGTTYTVTENFYIFSDMQPGEFRDINFSMTIDDVIYEDKMQIFTRTVFPVTNLTTTLEVEVEINGYHDWRDRWLR